MIGLLAAQLPAATPKTMTAGHTLDGWTQTRKASEVLRRQKASGVANIEKVIFCAATLPTYSFQVAPNVEGDPLTSGAIGHLTTRH